MSMPGDGLDPSWGLVMEQAFLQGRQWGKDIVFTFGPYGYHFQRIFHPELAAGLLAASAIRALLIGVGIALLLKDARPWQMAATLAAVALALPLAPDSAFFLLPLLAVLVQARQPRDSSLWYLLAIAAYCGFAALIKTTFAVLALALLLVVDIDRLVQRRPPLLTPVYVVAALAAYAAAGQSFSALPEFVSLSLQIASGFSRAMAIFDALRAIELAGFLAASVAVLVLVVLQVRRDRGLRSWTGRLLLAAVAAFWFVTYKAGFTRHDLHTLTAWSSLGIAGVLLAASAYDTRLSRLLMTAGLGLALLTPIRFAVTPGFSLDGVVKQTLIGGPHHTLSTAVQLATDPMAWSAERESRRDAALARIQARNPLPDGLGSVDTVPSLQGALIAADLAGTLIFTPRPVFQEYSTYTAPLIAANRDYMEGEDAPETVLLAPGSIDNRYPSLAEGPLWPMLRQRYEVGGVIGPVRHLKGEIDVLVLKRRAQELGPAVVPARILTPGVGERVELPMLDGPVQATIDLPLSMAGRLLTLLHQMPTVDITVTLADGSQRRHRLIPSIAQAGFILSPYMANATDARALFDGTTTDAGPRTVIALQVDVPVFAQWAFADRLKLALRPVR